VVSIEQSERYDDIRIVRVTHSEMTSDVYTIADGWEVVVKDEDEIDRGDAVLVNLENRENILTTEHEGRVRIENGKVIVSREIRDEEEYEIPSNARLTVKEGERVEPGQSLTEGSLNTHDLLRIRGREVTQMYLLAEVQNVYRSQGQNIHDKHFEVIIRKMMSRVVVSNPGDSEYLPGDAVNRQKLLEGNEILLQEGMRPAKYKEILLGITKASLSTDSFLSAASFQHTIRVLTRAAASGDEDPLYGLKENVIIGKLIPAGTGFEHGPFSPKPLIEDYSDLPIASIADEEMDAIEDNLGDDLETEILPSD